MRFILIALFICAGVFAQNTTHNLDYYFSELDSELLDLNIPTPKEIIGHEVGEWHVSHDKLVQYMYALANASDRVTIEDRGKTFEGRPILLLTITSRNNQLNIDEILEKHKKITDYQQNIKIEDQISKINIDKKDTKNRRTYNLDSKTYLDSDLDDEQTVRINKIEEPEHVNEEVDETKPEIENNDNFVTRSFSLADGSLTNFAEAFGTTPVSTRRSSTAISVRSARSAQSVRSQTSVNNADSCTNCSRRSSRTSNNLK